jgi:aspartyl-tRNA(Asn)/glutamyl-tRNA(Gln) amidotransferase subunit A
MPRALSPAVFTFMDELLLTSIESVSQSLRDRRVSPLALTQSCLDRIAQIGSRILAFISVDANGALEQARLAEAEIDAGKWRGPLHGVPIAIKDLVDVAGLKTTAASRVFEDRVASRDADVVRRLKQAGAVVLGKTNLHEFAFGGSGVISAYGPVANPWDTQRTTGGSSSGSAAAVAAGMCFAAIGTDTAGSIRVPASYCGLVGLKPSWGLVSDDGVIPLSKSLDHVGPITRTVRDAEIMLEAISDYKPERQEHREWRIAVSKKFFFEELSSEVNEAVNRAIDTLTLHEIPSQSIDLPVNVDRSIFNYEVWNYHREYVEMMPELYDPRTLARIRACATTTSDEYQEKQKEAVALREQARDLFRDVDVIVTPTSTIDPPLLTDLVDKPDLRAHELIILRNTRPINVLRLPTITIPCGLSSAGLPVGIQITAATDADCIGFAKVCEMALAFDHPILPFAG